MNQSVMIHSPIGELTIEGNSEAITLIVLPDENRRTACEMTAEGDQIGGVVGKAVKQLSEYFAGERTEFDLPFELQGTPFQKDVWLALAEIPFGKTISYAELANLVGRPSAYRAVGQANGANPIPIVLPCHRVLASGGRIGGYGGGLDMKKRLLAIEGISCLD